MPKRRQLERLRKEFLFIKQVFFPHWDRNGKWTVKIKPSLPCNGQYVKSKSEIQIPAVPTNKNELRRLLIHEIAHSASEAHSKKWINRMKKAYEKAQMLDLSDLASYLEKDVVGYSNSPKIRAEDVYRSIEDAIIECPETSFESLIKLMARYYGLYPEEFLRRYRRARKVYESARKFWQEEAKARAKFYKKIEDALYAAKKRGDDKEVKQLEDLMDRWNEDGTKDLLTEPEVVR